MKHVAHQTYNPNPQIRRLTPISGPLINPKRYNVRYNYKKTIHAIERLAFKNHDTTPEKTTNKKKTKKKHCKQKTQKIKKQNKQNKPTQNFRKL